MRFLWSLLLMIPLVGCQVNGHRKFEIEFMGNNLFTVEDTVSKNSDNKDEYKAGFDDDSSVVGWLIGSDKKEKNMTSVDDKR